MRFWPEAYTAVVVCTSHLPLHVAESMNEELDWRHNINWCYEKTGYGYRVWTESEGVPEEIVPIMDAARGDGFKWVEFDCDGDEVEGFQTWNW